MRDKTDMKSFDTFRSKLYVSLPIVMYPTDTIGICKEIIIPIISAEKIVFCDGDLGEKQENKIDIEFRIMKRIPCNVDSRTEQV